MYTLSYQSYQIYKQEHGLEVSAAEQRAADVRAGEFAAELRELWRCLGRAFRPGDRAGHRAGTVRAVRTVGEG